MRDRFTRYYQDCYPAVLAFCRRRAPHDAAEDLTAEVFTRAWRNMDRLADPDRPLPWLYGIARNVVGEFYRSSERHPEQPADLAGSSDNVAGTDYAVPARTDAVDTSIDVNRALLRLSTDDQELLMLSAWEDLDPRDIADILGIAPNTARVRVHRARTRLAQALEGVLS